MSFEEAIEIVLEGLLRPGGPGDLKRFGEARRVLKEGHAADSLLPADHAECKCAFPRIKYRNGSGHHPDCPVHKQWLRDGRRYKRNENAR